MKRPFYRAFRPGQIRSDESADIRDEIELYLELRTEELITEGMDPAQARQAAEERFGDTRRVEATLRGQARRRRTREGMMATLAGVRQDLGYAFRTMRRSPGFTFVAVLTLGLALGGNTAIFSVVDDALLQAMPFEDADQLVFVNGTHRVDGQSSIRGASFPEFRDWKERTRSLTSMAAVSNISAALTGGFDAERVPVEVVTEDYFEAMMVTPTLGRTFRAEEHSEPGAHTVALISAGLWERRFGGDPSVLGQDVLLNDRPFQVVGVLPAGFGGTALNSEVWVSEAMFETLTGFAPLEQRGSRFLSVIARVDQAMGPDEAQGELEGVALALQGEFPEAHLDRFAELQGFREAYLDTTGQLLWILMGAGVLLLLIASANVANLLLVRAHGRTREIVLRRALGAESSRVASQLLTESGALAVMGGVLGLGIAVLGLRVLGPMIPQGVLPGYVEPSLGAAPFLVSMLVLGIVGVVTGLLPALSSARMNIAARMREGGRGAVGGMGGRFRAQHLFVVAQVGLALVLLVGAGLLTRSFQAQLAIDAGTEFDQVMAMGLQLPESRYPAREDVGVFIDELDRRLSEIPGVAQVSIATDLPFRGGSSGAYIFRADAPDDRIRFHQHVVDVDYFETLGVSLVEGRTFTRTDGADAPVVGVVTEAMVRREFPNGSPVGQTMYLRPSSQRPVLIVGVVEDLRLRNLTTSLMAEGNSPDVFFPLAQRGTRGLEVAARVVGDPVTFGPAMRAVVAELDADMPVSDLAPLTDGYRAQTATPRFAAFLMGIFSALAAVLACVGMYGVLAFAVGQRSQEIAIRRAIGASAPSVARSVVYDGLRLAVSGLAVGTIVALVGSPVLESYLFQVESTDPTTFLTVGAVMIVVALSAALAPALRAMRRDPAEALYSD